MHPTRPTLRHLRIAALVEGATLLMLVGVAVPLKHLAGWPLGVTVMGPLHGLAFLAYLWSLAQATADGRLPARDAARWLAAALVPFGTWLLLRRAR